MIPRLSNVWWNRRKQSKQRARSGQQLPSLLPLFSSVLFLFFLARPLTAEEFKLSDGDHVVLIGSTLVEREQESGYWETALTTRFPKANVNFRNLGWSGDTVFCDARAMFDPPAVGFQHLKEELARLKPTVIFVGFGMNESFEGEAGLPHFQKGLASLLDMLGSTKARIVVLTPPPKENLSARLPGPAKHNQNLELYRDALRLEAQKRGHFFVDFFSLLRVEAQTPSHQPLTDNGIHFTDFGYWRSTAILERSLCGKPEPWFIDMDEDGTIKKAVGVQLSTVQSKPLRLQVKDTVLPTPVPPLPGPEAIKQVANVGRQRLIRVAGLSPGKYSLRIDGREVASASAEEWGAGVQLTRGPEFDQVEKLRRAIIEKNRLFFHRWRPQNETYLYGFRKHEQGQNAREIPEFDPLIVQLEKKIARLRMPATHQYELIASKE